MENQQPWQSPAPALTGDAVDVAFLNAAWKAYWQGDHPNLVRSLKQLAPQIEVGYEAPPEQACQFWLIRGYLEWLFEQPQRERQAMVRAQGFAEESGLLMDQLAVILQRGEHLLLNKEVRKAKELLQSGMRMVQVEDLISDPDPIVCALTGKLFYSMALASIRGQDSGMTSHFLEEAQGKALQCGQEVVFLSTAFGPNNFAADLVYLILCSGSETAAESAIEFAESVKISTLPPVRQAQLLTDLSLAHEGLGDMKTSAALLKEASRIIPHFRKLT